MKRIESVKNQHVKEWKRLHTRRGREMSRRFLVEGFHLVEEAIRANVKIDKLLVRENSDVTPEWLQYAEHVIIVSDQVMNEVAETKTPQGIVAICELHTYELTEPLDGAYLLIDRVQDPGNVGTIIRTADSAGISGVIIGEGTVDIFNSKVIRGSQGSIFHIPIVTGNLRKWMNRLKEASIPVYGTALTNATIYSDVEKQDSFALIVGNEGEGIQEELLNETDMNVYIPIYGKAESLNVAVATGILLYYFRE